MNVSELFQGQILYIENKQYRDFAENPVLNAVSEYYLRRKADNFYWNGSAFVSARTAVGMTKIGNVQAPGKWVAEVDTVTFNEGRYIVEIEDVSLFSKNRHQEFEFNIGKITNKTLYIENMQFRDFAESPVLNAVGRYYLRRKADDYYWDGAIFVASRTFVNMAKIGDIQAPGKWTAEVDSSAFDDGHYVVEIQDASAFSKNRHQEFEVVIGDIDTTCTSPLEIELEIQNDFEVEMEIKDAFEIEVEIEPVS